MLTNRILFIIFQGLLYFLNIFTWLIIINALLSWFMDPSHPIRSTLSQFVEPVINPFRRFTDRFLSSGLPIDLAPLAAYFTIYFLIQIIQWILYRVIVPYM